MLQLAKVRVLSKLPDLIFSNFKLITCKGSHNVSWEMDTLQHVKNFAFSFCVCLFGRLQSWCVCL